MTDPAASSSSPARTAGGGAGIQADIKTITMLGGHAMTAITAITAQNTLGVSAVHPVPAEMVLAQIDAVPERHRRRRDQDRDDRRRRSPRAVIAERLAQFEDVPIVFDPVMVATSGAALADDETIAAFGRLMDVATLATPNLPELRRLTSEEDPVAAALSLCSAHGCAVLVKGGHDEGDALADALIEEDNITSWQGQRIDTTSTHGTGCTLASAIAMLPGAGHASVAGGRAGARFVRIALHARRGWGRGRPDRPGTRCGSTSARDRCRASTRSR